MRRRGRRCRSLRCRLLLIRMDDCRRRTRWVRIELVAHFLQNDPNYSCFVVVEKTWLSALK